MLIQINHKEPGLKAARLYAINPDFFKEVKKEVLTLVQENAPSDVGEKKHVTNWTKPWGTAVQYSILNTSGQLDDTSIDHDSSIFNKKFHYSHKYPHLAQLIELFPHATNFRVNVMGPESRLSQHEECSCMGTKEGKPMIRARFHLPIKTNPKVYMFVDGDVFSFKEGTIYFFNNGGIHSAENNHEKEERIHLVWDMLLTEDTFARMFARVKYSQRFLTPSNSWELIPIFQRPIDPDYAANDNWYPLKIARSIQLCDMQ